MEPYLIPDVVTQQEESDELIDDYDEVQAEQEPNPTSHAKVRKARTKATVERVPGHTILQLSRVESVVRGDGGDSSLTKEATFALAIATEEFIKRISRLAWDRAQADYRSTLQYRDMARTARQVPQLNFLQDIIPLPIPLHQAMALRTARENGAEPEIVPAPASTPSAPLPKPKTKAARMSTASTAKSTSSKPPRQRDNRGRWSQGGALSAASPSGRGVKSDTDEQTELQAQAATNADGIILHPNPGTSPSQMPSQDSRYDREEPPMASLRYSPDPNSEQVIQVVEGEFRGMQPFGLNRGRTIYSGKPHDEP